MWWNRSSEESEANEEVQRGSSVQQVVGATVVSDSSHFDDDTEVRRCAV